MWAAIGECKSAGRRLSSRARAEPRVESHRDLALDAIAAINDCISNAPWLYLQQIYSQSPLQVAVTDRPIRAVPLPALAV